MVEADHALVAVDVAGGLELHALRLLEDRIEVDVRVLVEIDLAIDQRLHGRLRVRNPDQLEPVDARELRASEERGRLFAGARHIVRDS